MACKYRMTNGRRCKRQVIGEGFEYCAEHWYMLVKTSKTTILFIKGMLPSAIADDPPPLPPNFIRTSCRIEPAFSSFKSLLRAQIIRILLSCELANNKNQYHKIMRLFILPQNLINGK